MKQHFREFADAIDRGDYQVTDDGLLLKNAVLARGVYHAFVDGDLVERKPNLVPLQGLQYFLEAGLTGATAHTMWYLAIFAGAVNPMANWTAANFASGASEITSATEGYSNANRPQWVPGSISGSKLGNLSDLAAYNIVCTTNINIAGAALLSSNTKGGTSGVLVSATRFEAVHTVNNGSTFELGYEIELTDS